ncbi:tail fiber domain-containing protein, partial [Clostridium sp.]|uniref:tail fiber domain-containing protein n=1 Tax=Clostridium sp. TaxID=1506 RepID=UPI00261E03F4
NAITGKTITGGTINGTTINGGTINGSYIYVGSYNSDPIVTIDTSGINVQTGYLSVLSGSDRVMYFSNDGYNNAGIELGSMTTKTTPYIDFHSSGTSSDFDSRIISDNLQSIAHLNLISGAVYINGNHALYSSNIQSFAFNTNSSSTWGSFHTDANGDYGFNIWASDISLKTNIQDSPVSALSTINSIQHRMFNWKDSGQLQMLGYVAQELQKIEDSWVIKVPQEDGYIRMQPNETTIIPYLSKALQEEDAKVEDLKARIIVLENEIAQLKAVS